MATLLTDHERGFEKHATRSLLEGSVALLRDGDVILGDGDLDYTAADMLEVLGAMHDDTGIDVELLPQVRAFCIDLLDRSGWFA